MIPGSGRSPGGGNGNLLQYSCLENSMDRGAWWATAHGIRELDTTEQLNHPQCPFPARPLSLELAHALCVFVFSPCSGDCGGFVFPFLGLEGTRRASRPGILTKEAQGTSHYRIDRCSVLASTLGDFLQPPPASDGCCGNDDINPHFQCKWLSSGVFPLHPSPVPIANH